jgi:putative endonuclease
MRSYCAYIVASRRRIIYVGVTSDLKRRIAQHKAKLVPGFTATYNANSLVWFEMYDEPLLAIAREKQIKRWLRARKVRLIEAGNPEWRDLYDDI